MFAVDLTRKRPDDAFGKLSNGSSKARVLRRKFEVQVGR